MSEKITVHHVGGRDGSVAFPLIRVFSPDLVVFTYEADADSLEVTEAQTSSRPFEYRHIAAVLADSEKTVTLHINRDPWASSIFPLDTVSSTLCQHVPHGDYVLGDMLQPTETRLLHAVPLQHVIEEEGCGIDFLAMDAQGCETEILRGAGALLTEEILGICSEVSFASAYKGQGLFPELHSLMLERGFRLANLNWHPRCSWTRTSLAVRGGGFPVFGDALYLKDPNAVLARHRTPVRDLRKLAAICMMHDQFEAMVETLELLRPRSDWSDVTAGSSVYLQLLRDLDLALQDDEAPYPPTYWLRFQDIDMSLGSVVHENPHYHAAARDRYLQSLDRSSAVAQFRALASEEPRGVELALLKWGLQRSAEACIRRRREATLSVLEVLGFTSGPANTPDFDVMQKHLDALA